MKSTIEQQNNKTMMKSASLFEHDLKVGLFIVPLRKVNEFSFLSCKKLIWVTVTSFPVREL